MRVDANTDLVAFLQEVKKCKGDVWFETKEGDKLNLKSVLSQYLFVALTGNPEALELGRVTCEQESDSSLLERSIHEN